MLFLYYEVYFKIFHLKNCFFVSFNNNKENINSYNLNNFTQECGLILLELTSASFEFGDENSVESLRLNAELIDVIIDVFGEDNLGDIEKSLEFIGKIKVFCDRFYSKVILSII